MKVTVNQPVLNMTGKPFREGDKVIIVKDLLMQVALADLDKEEKAKLDDFNLFLKLKECKEEVELTNTEASRLQEKVKKNFGILIYGQLDAILEGKANPIKLVEDEQHAEQIP